jgi:hypothetical protein
VAAGLTPLVAGAGNLAARLRIVPLARWGMVAGHVGVGLFILGVTLVKGYESTAEVRMAPGDSTTVGGYGFQFLGVAQERGPNYVAARARIQVTWAGQVAPDLKGFISVFANTMYDVAKAEKGLGGKSFAVITDSYLNFNSRLGYHFAILDAYVSEEKNDNYISYQFKGGAAGVERRERRARLLSEILDYLGFKVQVIGDMVRARMVKYSLLETEQTLELVGLLSAFARQLDLALTSEAVVERCFQAFKEEDYNLSFLRPEPSAT